MKLLALATVIGTASAFTAPMMTFAVGKKAPAKKAAVTKPVPKKAAATKAVKAAATKPAAKKAVKPAPKKVTPKKVVAKKVVAKKVAPKKVVAKKVAPKKVVPKKVAPKPKPKPAPKKVVAKKVAPRPAPKPVRTSGKFGTIPSQAIPNEVAPAILDGSLVGDVGFDPCFLSTKADTVAPYFNGLFKKGVSIDGLTWYREAELMHGRIAMLATLGFIIPGLFHFAGTSWTGVDAYAETNPLLAWGSVPQLATLQILIFMAALEFRRIRIIQEEGSAYMAGNSQRWGQGGYNPFGFNYTPQEYQEKQLQEIKHARLAMIGLLGLIFQANASGVNVVDQLKAAFITPDYAAKAGYYFPEGI